MTETQTSLSTNKRILVMVWHELCKFPVFYNNQQKTKQLPHQKTHNKQTKNQNTKQANRKKEKKKNELNLTTKHSQKITEVKVTTKINMSNITPHLAPLCSSSTESSITMAVWTPLSVRHRSLCTSNLCLLRKSWR